MNNATDQDIQAAHTPLPITQVAARLGLGDEELESYGSLKAKIQTPVDTGKRGKLVLVTAMSPTPAGEGKTTVTIGLGDAMAAAGHRTAIALREPSLGPCLGMKGGATGGGRAQIMPAQDINMHFTGDLHAVTSAHNLLAAMADNHLHFRKAPCLDARRIAWKRVMDMNDRSLRHITTGLGGPANGVPHESGFDITAASEVMACLCLASSADDLRERLSRMVVGQTAEREDVTASDIGGVGAMVSLLKDALRPNLVQTLEGVPAFVHGGPFANIAHGASSVIGTRTALQHADVVFTEAGFGCDLGGEKFFGIVCPAGDFKPSAAVLVTTARGLKFHGGVAREALGGENLEALRAGLCNLDAHLNTLSTFNVPVLVAVNRFTHDTEAELNAVIAHVRAKGVQAVITNSWAEGSAGGQEAAAALAEILAGAPGDLARLYAPKDSTEDKITAIAQKVYGADGVEFSPKARRDLARIQAQGLDTLPVCMAKTEKSLSDDPSRKGRPTGFTVTVREILTSHGAGFHVPLAGDILRMPGLPREPGALAM